MSRNTSRNRTDSLPAYVVISGQEDRNSAHVELRPGEVLYITLDGHAEVTAEHQLGFEFLTESN